MNASVQQPPNPPEIVTQESLLLAAAERIGRIREGRTAVYLHLSQLRAENRQEAYLRIAVRMLEPLVQVYRAQLFLLDNSDIVILCKDARPVDLDHIVYRLRALFSKDPLTYGDEGDGRDRFFTWYDMEVEYSEFLALTRRLDATARQRQRNRPTAAQSPLEPQGLHGVATKLAEFDVAQLVRRQSTVKMAERNRAIVDFQEFYVSVADLQRAVAQGTNLLGNRWLFQHLTQTLDLRVLQAIADGELRRLAPALSLNLNIPTLHAAEFQALEKTMAARGIGLVIELQVIDVFADLGGFFYARDMLREKGHRVLLDGITALTLQFLDLAQYDTDLIKLFWSPDFLEGKTGAEVRRAFDGVGLERAVLGRCDSEAAIQWGLDAGIPAFQGRYVDAMQSAMAMAGCPKAKLCTLPQCIQRHGVIAGPLRGECHDLDMLDSFPELRAPSPKPQKDGKA